MNRKDYLITVYECGDEVMSEGDVDRQVLPRRYWEVVSLTELRKRLETIYRGFWTHPDLKEDFSNEKEIPFNWYPLLRPPQKKLNIEGESVSLSGYYINNNLFEFNI